VRQYVMSATRNWLGRLAVNWRSTRSAGLPVSGAGLVVLGPLWPGNAAQAELSHEPTHRGLSDMLTAAGAQERTLRTP
jgi:hypothetical protein